MNFANKQLKPHDKAGRLTRFKQSAQEIRHVKSITGCAMLTAIDIILKVIRIDISAFLSIGFSSLAVAVSGLYYGPLLTGMAGVIADTLGYLVHPNGPYFPGFAISAFFTGVIYGCFFYKQNITIKRVILARLCITVCINLLLTPLWLNMMYGNALFAVPRIVKNIVMFPLDVWMLHVVLKTALRIRSSRSI